MKIQNLSRGQVEAKGGTAARAFTLLEVMIVIVIILAIAGLVTVNLMGTRAKATVKTVEIQMTSLRDAINAFNLDLNRYPTDDEGLSALWDKSKLADEGDQAKWRSYMEQPIALDDWGSAWVYRQVGEKAPEGKFDLISVGPDKEEGTEDDINVWPKSALEGVEGSGGSSDSPPAASPRRLSPAMCLSASLGVSTEAYVRVRAFTLIELMIALAIVAMLAGIVLPIGLSRLNADAFAQAQRQVEAAVGIARADAQRTGVHVKLIAVVDGGVVLFSQAHGAADRPDTSGKRSLPRREFVLELPTGVQIESEPDTEEEHANQDGDEVRTAREGSASASDGSSATELALCVLMPDGTVVPGEPVLLVARDGKRARIEFNPWTGALTFLPVTAAHVAGAADASAPAPDPTRGPGGESGLSNEDAP